MIYIDQYQWQPSVNHSLGVAGAMSEYIKRSGAYVGPDDPFADDDFENPKNYLPEVPEEVKQELRLAIKFLRMAYVYELRFHNLRSGDDEPEEFLTLLRAQLEEVGFHKCENCGVRDTPDWNMDCQYCESPFPK